MAFNGSGTYNLPAGNPVVTGTTISSTTTNTTNSDIATALTNCITRDGQSTPSANLPMNAKKLTGLAAGTTAGDSVRYEQVVLTGAALGTPSSGTLTSCTGLPLSTGITGTLPVANGGTGSTSTTYCSLATNVTGTLPVANGGTGTTTPALVAGTNVTISGTWPNQTINASGGTSLTGVTGATNTALGVSALTSVTTGTANSAIGVSALRYITTGGDNTAVGWSALYSNTAYYNIAVGSSALYSNTTGSPNIAVGWLASYSNTTGYNNVATGDEALYNNTTGSNNVAFGPGRVLYANTTGTYNIATGTAALRFNSTGNDNIAVGPYALYSNTTGSSNVTLGNSAFYSNTTGNNNVGIGNSVASSTTTVSNEVNIYNGTVTARFQGSASSWSFVSDIRDKTNIVDLELGLNFINKLQPRKFEWDLRHTDSDKGKVASGFIAQEVLSVLEQEDALFTGLVDTNDSEKYMLAQTNLIPILVNAIKELSAELAALKLKVGN